MRLIIVSNRLHGYDGTLVPFVEDPKLAQPDWELMDLLGGLSAAPGNELAIVSGRPRRDEDLFRALPPSAYSVQVGLANTAARYYLSNHTAVRRMLRELGQVNRERDTGPSASNGPSQAAGSPRPRTQEP